MGAISSLLLLGLLAKTCLGQGCTLDACNAACISWEVANSFCHRDSQTYDSMVSCLCEYPFHTISSYDKAADLQQCVACNVANVGPSALSYYQIWTTICNAYAGSGGEQAAIDVSNSQSTDVIRVFSTALLPSITAKFCGAAVVTPSTSTSTSRLSTTSSMSLSVSTPSALASYSTTNPVGTSSSTFAAASTINTASTSSAVQASASAQSSVSAPASNSALRVGSRLTPYTTPISFKHLLVTMFIGAGLLMIDL